MSRRRLAAAARLCGWRTVARVIEGTGAVACPVDWPIGVYREAGRLRGTLPFLPTAWSGKETDAWVPPWVKRVRVPREAAAELLVAVLERVVNGDTRLRGVLVTAGEPCYHACACANTASLSVYRCAWVEHDPVHAHAGQALYNLARSAKFPEDRARSLYDRCVRAAGPEYDDVCRASAWMYLAVTGRRYIGPTGGVSQLLEADRLPRYDVPLPRLRTPEEAAAWVRGELGRLFAAPD